VEVNLRLFLGFGLCAAVSLYIGALSLIGIAFQATTKVNCQKIAGQWLMTYSGTSCAREIEEGVFTLNVKADCSFHLKRESTFPFFSTLLGSEDSLQFENDHIKATVVIPFDYCSKIIMEGTIKKTSKGLQLIGTYRYDSGGGGRFRGVLKETH
jgi:hypothetical protein